MAFLLKVSVIFYEVLTEIAYILHLKRAYFFEIYYLWKTAAVRAIEQEEDLSYVDVSAKSNFSLIVRINLVA